MTLNGLNTTFTKSFGTTGDRFTPHLCKQSIGVGSPCSQTGSSFFLLRSDELGGGELTEIGRVLMFNGSSESDVLASSTA